MGRTLIKLLRINRIHTTQHVYCRVINEKSAYLKKYELQKMKIIHVVLVAYFIAIFNLFNFFYVAIYLKVV